jgi:hypothetical protein
MMPRVFLASTVRLTVASLLLACSTATQRAFVAPSDDTIVTETEERQGEPPTHLIFVVNRSTVPVTVFSFSLRNCENVKQPCRPTRMNLRVRPGERVVAMRVQPDNPQRGFSYSFNYGWNADSSGAAALGALAASGDVSAQQRLADRQRADSIDKAHPGPRYHELTRDDFGAIAGRVASLRAEPESLTLAPGERSSIDRIRILVVSADGQVLGRTRWVQWMVPGPGTVDFSPPDRLTARRPGRAVIRFGLADEAQQIIGTEVAEIEVPVVVAYRVDPNAPLFAGQVVDADTKTPLGCVRVALEDSLQNVVSASRTTMAGTFNLQAPHPGSFRVRVETHGWAPSYGPVEVAAANETKQREYPVRFTEQMLTGLYERPDAEFQRARPAAVSTEPVPTRSTGGRARTTPIVTGVTLGGSESMPILGIIGRVQPMTTWMQFVVDSAGRVDTTSVLLSPGTPASAKASVNSVLPRVRFAPAREAGKPTCELIRMQVNFSPR